MALLGALSSSPPEEGAAGAPPSPRERPVRARERGAALRRAPAARAFARGRDLLALAALATLAPWAGARGQLAGGARRGTLAELLADLGPTFIKIGQALDPRDLLPAEYCLALASLQDRGAVAASTARGDPRDELGEKTPRRAAHARRGRSRRRASGRCTARRSRAGRGRGRRRGRRQVQRRRVGDRLDLLLLRALSGAADAAPLETDLVEPIDEWGGAFVDELDYRRGRPTRPRSASRSRRARATSCSPVASTRDDVKVLVTGWVDGERLDQSDATTWPGSAASR